MLRPRRLAPLLTCGLILLAATTLRAQGLPAGDAASAGFQPEALARIGSLLDSSASSGRIAGGSALVARRGKVVYLSAAGHRDREADLPMTADTIVRIASMTKPITSVAILQLVDAGKIHLEDPVSKYIPEFAEPSVLVMPANEKSDQTYSTVPAGREITIHHLLTHTSGLIYRFMGHQPLSRLYAEAAVSDGLHETPGTIADNASRIAAQPLEFRPGDAWNYSLSTDVLGRVVEVASGQSFDQYLKTHLFDPLRMTDTAFIVPPDKRPRLSAVYGSGPDGQLTRTTGHPVQDGLLVYSPTYPTWDHSHYFSGGAGLSSTLGDYARFLQMLLNRGALDGARILKPETVDLMTSNRIGDLPMPDWGHGDRFGYGVAVVSKDGGPDEPAAGAFSWGGFFYTYFWVDPKRDLIGILFTQTYPSGDLKLREEFRRLTYEALED